MNPRSEILCPVHKDIQSELQEVRKKQGGRPCLGHEARLKNLEENNADQWTAINELRRMVWKGAGIIAGLAFLGSGLGAAIVSYLFKR